jgi:hypothetical protein
LMIVCELVRSAEAFQTMGWAVRGRPAARAPAAPALRAAGERRVVNRMPGRSGARSAECGMDLFEKDCVEFVMPPDMQAQHAPSTRAYV